MIESFVYFLITLAISIALSPRPKAPKAAALEDFDFPTAEEGRPIPVVFGTVDITGPNVLWYGDLRIKSIKKRSGFSKATVGYQYYIGFHLGLCHGPVDAVTRVAWDQKEVWTGNFTTNATGSISLPDLFGGKSRGGGVEGSFNIEMGGPSQIGNDYLTTKIGSAQPGYRGILGFVWRGGWIGNSEFVRPVAVRVTRIAQGWQGSTWYSSKINAGNGMNPAHIIYQCLTDSDWGMGVPTDRVSSEAFEAAADTLYDEDFGLNLSWNQAASIQQFIQAILDHIGGGLSLRLDTGKYELTLFRGGYDPGTLPLYDESNVVSLLSYQKQGWGTTSNEITLVYTDPTTLKETSLTAQDLGNVDAQGTRIPAVVELIGIRDHDVARQVLARELAQRTTPLTKISIVVNRKAWNLRFGDVFRFDWQQPVCDDKVFRVISINRGELQDNKITIEAIEDIYQYPVGAGLEIQDNGDAVIIPATPPEEQEVASVISITLTDPPVSPQDGDSYYVPIGATGAWAGNEGKIAEWDDFDGVWVFTDLPDGAIGYVEDSQQTVQVVGGVLNALFSAGSSSVIAGGFAVDKSYLWRVKATAPDLVPGGIFERRIRGLGIVVDVRYISGTNPTAMYRRNANTGEQIDLQNTIGPVYQVVHDQGDRYYYTCGYANEMTPRAVVRKVDMQGTGAYAVVEEYEDSGVDRFISITRMGAYIYAIGAVDTIDADSKVVKLNAEDLTFVDEWTFSLDDRPYWLANDTTNLWGVCIGGDVVRIDITDGSTDVPFAQSYGGFYDAYCIYNDTSNWWELWVSYFTNGSGDAVLACYRLNPTPPNTGHGSKVREYTHPTQFSPDEVRTTIAIDGNLVSWGRDLPDEIMVIPTQDIFIPNVGTLTAFVPVDRADFTSRTPDFYTPAFLPQIDAIPFAVDTVIDPAKTWVPVYREEEGGTPRGATQRMLLQDVVGSGGGGGNASRGATWVRPENPIETPVNDVLVLIPDNATITGVSILTIGGPGNCTVDIYVADPGVSYPPGPGDSITGGSPPEITAGEYLYDTTLTGWTTTINAGDVVLFKLSASTNFTYVSVTLHLG